MKLLLAQKLRPSAADASIAFGPLFIVTFVIGLFYISRSPISTGGDSEQYIAIADALIGRPGAEFIYYRTWGYPLFLVLCGYPWLHSVKVVIGVQLVLGSTVPWLIAESLRRIGVSRSLSLGAALTSIISLSPLVLVHVLLGDQVNLFLLYLAIWLLVKELRPSEHVGWRQSISLAAVFVALSLVRPANVVLGVCVLGVALDYFPAKNRVTIGGALAIVVIATAFLSLKPVERAHAYLHNEPFVQGSLSGAMFFWNIYASGETFAGERVLKPTNGPCSEKIYETVRRNVDSVKGYRGTADEALNTPTLLNHYAIWQSLEKLGLKQMNDIFWCAAFEGIKAEPKTLLYFVDGMLSFFLVSDVIYNDGHRQAWPSAQYYGGSIDVKFGAWALYVGTAIKIIAFLVAICTFVPTFNASPLRRAAAIAIWTIVLCHSVVHVVFAAPHWRYTLVIIPALVFLAALGVDSAMGMNRRRAAKIETKEITYPQEEEVHHRMSIAVNRASGYV
jgi:hypothetical protein